jgi:hypothetical protein
MNAEQKKTPEEVLAGASEYESVIWANCPCCNHAVAFYIRPSKPVVAVSPMIAVTLDQNESDGRLCSSV